MSERDERPEDAAGASDEASQPSEPGTSEEEAWREIVENYGERPSLDETPVAPSIFEQKIDIVEPVDEPDPYEDMWRDDDEGYVPPPPPPLPRTTPARFLAWLGVLGAPVAVLALIVVTQVSGRSFSSWVIGGLVAAFLAGFVYLLVTMSNEPRDPWDDGARV
ncbi:hypothetical protein FB381_3171 [Nocardioides albertanoniae]|uniref:Uncharacterized protein n=1 Tax=Nocardioides albertanoniae TaxID=1175486 RepID=A0A543A9Y2_9ACTN|nr:hypothetical protein [Nocardioides albertanoniae]TQL69266.1 hypothetical protein FB381_3171 [Nocardioides albertanoniae]